MVVVDELLEDSCKFLAVAEEHLEDNCQFCHRQDLEDVCFNILLMVDNLNKSHY